MGINEISTIITERVDDIPLLLEQMQRMGLPALLDERFPKRITENYDYRVPIRVEAAGQLQN